ncbi:TlpA family protein disulfide reductase [Corallincola spongiicola]|uniref:TlpA family protein disulfide reductase n=1 Tax=Corallincola spongiicola TaxID=2520508 RepID=A0ABY1WTZ0_9GAMM|nr:TlpA family protein disulfide reductase [Corallincola spongiicola]
MFCLESTLAIWERCRAWVFQLLFFVLVWWVVQWLYTQKLLDVGETLPAFELVTLEQEVVSSDSLRGRPTLLYFFAPWCGVCHFSIDAVDDLKLSNPNLNVIAVALDYQSTTEVDEFIAQHDLTIPVVLGDRAMANAYKITAFPTYYTIDSTGIVVSKDMGVTTSAGLLARTWLAKQ